MTASPSWLIGRVAEMTPVAPSVVPSEGVQPGDMEQPESPPDLCASLSPSVSRVSWHGELTLSVQQMPLPAPLSCLSLSAPATSGASFSAQRVRPDSTGSPHRDPAPSQHRPYMEDPCCGFSLAPSPPLHSRLMWPVPHRCLLAGV